MNRALTNSIEIKIAWGDCDPAGIVFYPNYFRFFNIATDALFDSAGFSMAKLMKDLDIIGYPMIMTGANFIIPNRYDDIIRIETCIRSWGNSSFQVQHLVHNQIGLSIEAEEKRLFAYIAEDGELKGLPVPQTVKDRMTTA